MHVSNMEFTVEIVQLVSALMGAGAAIAVLLVAVRQRRIYVERGGNDPDMLVQAEANVFDESIRLSKHITLVAVGLISIVFGMNAGSWITVRLLLVLISLLMCVQSYRVYSLWDATVRRFESREESRTREAVRPPHEHRRKDDLT